MIETVEQFKCPECKATNFVRWKNDETERTIPCLSCYAEIFNPETQSMDSTGARILCIRGTGKTVKRDENTFEEV